MARSLLDALKPPPPAPPITNPLEVAGRYGIWRIRVMAGMLIGYAIFYFCRQNMSMANKPLSDAFHFTRREMGLILSTATIVYAFSKFLSGVLADRMNASLLMGAALILSALMNVGFGLSPALAGALGLESPLALFIAFWALNNLFQGAGVPPCSKLLANWYAPSESGTAWGVWNSSHQIGGAAIVVLAGYLVAHHGWESAFHVPALIGLAGGVFILVTLRDTPQSQGLPPVEVFKGDVREAPPPEAGLPFGEVMRRHILTNRMIWLVCVGNFFVYVVRKSVLDWGPRFLQEAKDFSPEMSSYATSGFELAGIAGAFASGWISDRWFKGRRGPAMVAFMLCLAAAIGGLLLVRPGDQWGAAAVLIAIGFFVYGPQMLVAVAASDFATKEAAATAVGLTGFFGYVGATVSGYGTGWLVDAYGWDTAFLAFLISAGLGTVCFLFTWNQRSPLLEQIHDGG
jgi:phosphoglycerate transporter family protein